MANHSYHTLRQERLNKATKPFNARGARLIRCEHCLLGQNFCICAQVIPVSSRVDWIVLMHHDEVLKPTNTGRLIADVLPSNTHVFEWARILPPDGVLTLLADPKRYIIVVFPAENALLPNQVQQLAQLGNRQLTLIMLDGTWKQARKMFNRTPWLAGLPAVQLPMQMAHYSLRKAVQDGCLSTVEAAIGLLEHFDPAAAVALQDVFLLFNQGYILSRGLRAPINNANSIQHLILDQLE